MGRLGFARTGGGGGGIITTAWQDPPPPLPHHGAPGPLPSAVLLLGTWCPSPHEKGLAAADDAWDTTCHSHAAERRGRCDDPVLCRSVRVVQMPSQGRPGLPVGALALVAQTSPLWGPSEMKFSLWWCVFAEAPRCNARRNLRRCFLLPRSMLSSRCGDGVIASK